LPDTEHQKQPDSNAPRVLAFELHLDGSQLMGLELQPDARLHSVCLNFEHPILKAALDKLLDDEARRPSGAYLFVDQPSEEEKVRWEQEQKEYKARLLSELDGIEQVIEEYIRKVPFSTEHFLPAGLVPEGEESEYAYAMPDEQPDAIMDSFDQGGAEGIARKLRYEIEQLFKLISRSISARLNRITYLGPLRCYPPRHSTGMHDQDPNWFSGGGQAWEILRGDPDVLMAVNQWLAAPDRLAKGYELLVRDLSNIQKIAPELQAGLEDALGKLRAEPNASITEQVESVLKKLTASKSGVVLSEIILQDIRSKTEVSHRDIGQGISQVLPILVSAFALEKQIVAIEQPELHLHPGLQAELGDVFIESALGERANKFLIESVTSGMGQQDAF
jgi:hypothetical protein